MNCKECQKKILESLAASESVIPEVARHRSACAACAAFYREQQELFRTVDDGLQSLVNQPVPPSLLPRVRGRLDEVPVSPRAWWPAWSLAAVAAIATLALAVEHVPRRPRSVATSGQTASIAPECSVPPASIREHARTLARPKALVLPAPNHKSATSDVPPNAAPEVIVSAEERQAFTKFVSEVPEEPQAALALTRPAASAAQDSIEIALLQIDNLEVKPLEGTESE